MHWQCVAPDGDDGENKRDAVRFRADRCHVDELCRAIRVCGPLRGDGECGAWPSADRCFEGSSRSSEQWPDTAHSGMVCISDAGLPACDLQLGWPDHMGKQFGRFISRMDLTLTGTWRDGAFEFLAIQGGMRGRYAPRSRRSIRTCPCLKCSRWRCWWNMRRPAPDSHFC